MSTEVFIHQCRTCGVVGMKIAQIKKQHPDAQVIDTRKDNAMLGRHIFFLKQAGIVISEYVPIVVRDNGKVITRLSDWRG